MCNNSHILFLDPVEPSDSTLTEQIQITYTITESPEKSEDAPPKTFALDQSHSTPPSFKKTYDMMKDPAFLTSSIYPPRFFANDALSTQRDDHQIPFLSHD